MYIKNSPISKFKHNQPENPFCIYCLIDPRDNSPKYIGLTTNGFTRIASHYNKTSKENTRKVNWIKKLKSLGLCFRVEYLEYCNSETELKLAETKWIKYYRDDLKINLLNHTDGGESVYRKVYTEEERKIISERNKKIFRTEAIRDKMRKLAEGNTHRRGKKYSSEQLENITKRNREISGKKIIDQFGTIYPSIRFLSKKLKCSMNTIKDRLNINPNKPLKGLILKRVD